MGRTLFVSYSRNDHDPVATLIEDLEGFDHSPWMDRQLTGGLDWWSELLRHIRECDLFIFAVSEDSVTSEACLREYEYATALGKPVLPVTVRTGASDALLPASLGHIQRVDYSSPDRAALTRLIKSINAMPEAEPLPIQLPDEPEIPATYLYDLNKEIGSAEEMSSAKQDEIVGQLRHQANEGDSPEAVRHMIERMRQREDLLLRVSSQLSEIETSLPGPETTEQPRREQEPVPPPTQAETQSPSPPRPEPLTPPAIPRQPPTGQPAQPVNPLWWLAVLFAPIGGIVAWAVVKEQDEKKARNMLITSLALMFVYIICSNAALLA